MRLINVRLFNKVLFYHRCIVFNNFNHLSSSNGACTPDILWGEIILWVSAIVKICKCGFNPEDHIGDRRISRAEGIRSEGLVPNLLLDELIVDSEMDFSDNLLLS